PFKKHPAVPERAAGFTLRGAERGAELRCRADHAHAATATARNGLDQEWKTDTFGLGQKVRLVLALAEVAGHDRNARTLHEGLRLILHAHQTRGARGRAHERDAGSRAAFGEFSALRQETVARMDGLGAGCAGSLQDRIDVEVTLTGGCRPDAHGLIGDARVERTGVGVGVHGNRADTQPLRGARYPACDLAT